MTWAITPVRDALAQHRLPFGDEVACQRTVALILESLGLRVQREFTLEGARGRIDIYLPDDQVGIELKVKGSPTDVLRQLLRYASSPLVRELVLLTGRARLGRDLPSELAGKPFHVISTWQSGL